VIAYLAACVFAALGGYLSRYPTTQQTRVARLALVHLLVTRRGEDATNFALRPFALSLHRLIASSGRTTTTDVV